MHKGGHSILQRRLHHLHTHTSVKVSALCLEYTAHNIHLKSPLILTKSTTKPKIGREGPSQPIMNRCHRTAKRLSLFLTVSTLHSLLDQKYKYGAQTVHNIKALLSVFRWAKHYGFLTSSKQLTRTSLQPSSREASWTFPGWIKFKVIAKENTSTRIIQHCTPPLTWK